jgi:hypothetical protein
MKLQGRTENGRHIHFYPQTKSASTMGQIVSASSKIWRPCLPGSKFDFLDPYVGRACQARRQKLAACTGPMQQQPQAEARHGSTRPLQLPYCC